MGHLPSGPIFQIAHGYKTNLLVGVDEEGVVGIVDVATKRRKSRWMAHHNAVFDVIWTHDDVQILTAAGDLEIRIWDVERASQSSMTETTPVSTLKGHDMSVKCVRQAPDNANVFASGGRDGKVLLWDTRTTGKPVASLENVHAEPTSSRASSPNVSFTSPIQKRRRRGAASSTSSSPRSVTCVEFGSTGKNIATAGAVDAVVKFWDLRRLGTDSSTSRGKKKAIVKVPAPVREISCSSREGARRGISSLAIHNGGSGGASRLLVNVLNDSIAVVDIGATYQGPRTILRCSGHQASSFYNKATFSPEGNFIAASSVDGIVYVWDARVSASCDVALPVRASIWTDVGVQRAPCFALKGHSNEVNGVSWSSQDFTQLASCSDDGTIRCWQVGGERKERHSNQPKETNGQAASFELQINLSEDDCSSDQARKTEWENWVDFLRQPDGYAYRVQGFKLAPISQPSHPLSPTQRRVPQAKQRGSPLVTQQNAVPRLHPVHETLTAQKQPQQEPQVAQEPQPKPKRRSIKLRRKTKPSLQPKRAQRTLLELWGK
ncbi:Denticleless [Phytophthora citrophthora]|uniref:Denticleless n=1 Tax=Phytophthora citrophthora TaxID=4793 RepID=A0AAD9LGH8_9STRA|nr:Denticleless [Phytophthora citrophthora]